MPSVLSQFFSKDHWKHPFTIKIPTASDPSIFQKERIGKGKRITAIFLSVVSGIFSLGFLAVPVFFLSTSAFKNWELRQRNFTHDTAKSSKNRFPRGSSTPSANTPPNPNDLTPNNKQAAPLFASASSPAPQSQTSPLPFNGPKPQRERQLTPLNTSKKIRLVDAKALRLPPPPEDGIKVGLSNPSNNCWLNTSLKMIAHSTFWDYIFTCPIDDKQLGIISSKDSAAQVEQDLQDLLHTFREQKYTSNENREALRQLMGDLNTIFSSTNLDPQKIKNELKKYAEKQNEFKELLKQLSNGGQRGERSPITDAQNEQIQKMFRDWDTLFSQALIQHALDNNQRYKKDIIDFQALLKNFIYTLRAEKEGHIGLDDCQALEKLAASVMRKDQAAGTGAQMDASEFFLALQPLFDIGDTGNSQNYFSVMLYQPSTPEEIVVNGLTVRDNAHYPSFSASPIVTISIPPGEAADSLPPISFMDLLRNTDETTVHADFAIKSTPIEISSQGTNFKTENYPTHLPSLLNFYWSRLILDAQGGQVKSKRLYQIDEEGKIYLNEYNQEKIGQYERKPWSILPKSSCIYEISSAVVHNGSGYGGHYVSIQKTEQGEYFEHSDNQIKALSPKDALEKIKTQGTLLQFKCVGIIPSSDSDITHRSAEKARLIKEAAERE